ncbi:MAG: alpha/beta fold hydrolase [Chloroflexota bacterium]
MSKPADGIKHGGCPAVLLLSGGLMHKVGPNRAFVRLARRLAAMGRVAMRFDRSGVGDSDFREDSLSVEASAPLEIGEAMSFLTETTGVDRFVLIGHCSGASMAFLTACRDPRVCGVVLANAPSPGEDWTLYDRRRKVARYYENRYGKAALLSPRKWLKLLSGRADYGSIINNVLQGIVLNRLRARRFEAGAEDTTARLAANLPPELGDIPAYLQSLVDRGVNVLFVFSEGNTGLDYLKLLLGGRLDQLAEAETIQLEIIPRADHTFTLMENQSNLMSLVGHWLDLNWPSDEGALRISANRVLA